MQLELRPGAKGKGVIFVLVLLVVLSVGYKIVSFLGIPLIEHIVVKNFIPAVGRILIWIDDAGQGRRFQVVRHLEAFTRLKQCLLLWKRRRGGKQGWVYIGDGKGVVFKEGVSAQLMSLR